MDFSHLEEAKEKLSPNNLEAGLPGRESQSEEIYNFLHDRLKIRQAAPDKKARIKAGLLADIRGTHMNKTMFVCGVPGTGKTATIKQVEHKLKKLLDQNPTPIHKFQSAYINGQHLSAPIKVYSEILYKFTGEQYPPDRAQERLEEIFKQEYIESEPKSTKKGSRKSGAVKKKLEANSHKLIIIDELDVLYDEKRQAIFYNLFDWPTSSESKVVLIVIANAMDLPARFMRGRVASRLGWEICVFEPYTSDNLSNILEIRLGQKLLYKCFEKKAILVATKRIGRTTGDARRILDTCRLAIDKAIETNVTKVSLALIDKVGFQNLDLQKSQYLLTCPPLELALLQAILLETDKAGDDNVESYGVWYQLVQKVLNPRGYKLKGSIIPSPERFEMLQNTLAANNLIYLEDEKPLFRRHMYLRNCGAEFKNQIRAANVLSRMMRLPTNTAQLPG